MLEHRPIVLKRPDRLPPVTEELIAQALQVSMGIQKDAAAILHITPQALSQRISRSKNLQKARNEIRYQYVDKAMSVILRELNACNQVVAMLMNS